MVRRKPKPTFPGFTFAGCGRCGSTMKEIN